MLRRVRCVFVVLCIACGDPAVAPDRPADPTGFVTLCEMHSDCVEGEFCVAGLCTQDRPDTPRPEPDGGVDDSGVTTTERDGGVPRDGGTRDAGPRDGGEVGPSIDLSGWRIVNMEHNPPMQTFDLPEGTVLVPGQHLMLVRGVDRTVFEEELAVDLGNAIYIRTDARSNGIPIVNGGESWAIEDDTGAIVDGPTIVGGVGYSYRRRSAGDATYTASWVVAGEIDDVPGTTLLPASGVGVRIAQWSDESGTGRFVYEYVELYYAP